MHSLLIVYVYEHVSWFFIGNIMCIDYLRTDVYYDFYSIGTDPMVSLSFSAASLTYQCSLETLIQPIGSSFRGPTQQQLLGLKPMRVQPKRLIY